MGAHRRQDKGLEPHVSNTLYHGGGNGYQVINPPGPGGDRYPLARLDILPDIEPREFSAYRFGDISNGCRIKPLLNAVHKGIIHLFVSIFLPGFTNNVKNSYAFSSRH